MAAMLELKNGLIIVQVAQARLTSENDGEVKIWAEYSHGFIFQILFG